MSRNEGCLSNNGAGLQGELRINAVVTATAGPPESAEKRMEAVLVWLKEKRSPQGSAYTLFQLHECIHSIQPENSQQTVRSGQQRLQEVDVDLQNRNRQEETTLAVSAPGYS